MAKTVSLTKDEAVAVRTLHASGEFGTSMTLNEAYRRYASRRSATLSWDAAWYALYHTALAESQARRA